MATEASSDRKSPKLEIEDKGAEHALAESHSAPLLDQQQQATMVKEQQPRPYTVPLSAEDYRLLMLMGITPQQLAESGKSIEYINQFGLDVELS
jgi:hypothetical protein